ncbi:MAG: clostripain-related cysteine peptidase [Mucinivorans sp.]
MKNILYLLIISLLISCRSEPQTEPEPQPSEGRTVLMYIIADNNLESFAIDDINEMEAAWAGSMGPKDNILVFLNRSHGRNQLYKIVEDNNIYNMSSPVIKDYPEEMDPTDPAVLRAVIDDVQRMYPSKSYGLGMWSHGSGWVPSGDVPLESPQPEQKKISRLDFAEPSMPEPKEGTSYVIGITNRFRRSMEIDQMAKVLSGLHFDFIFFDACYMGSVELAYELRHVCDYLVSSVAEIVVKGAPYDLVAADMVRLPTREAVVTLATKYYNHCQAQSGNDQSSTISVVESSKLETVAQELKKIVTPNPRVPINSIQQFGRSDYVGIYHDLDDFVKQTWGTMATAQFSAALNQAVIYKAATAKMFQFLDIKTHCGLSAYIPRSYQRITLNAFITRYGWSKASGLDKMIE